MTGADFPPLGLAEAAPSRQRHATIDPQAPSRSASDAQLQGWIAQIMHHDQAAFNALYEACAGRVYGLALRITRNAALAEEVSEDTFWQVWREAPRFDPARGTALAWLLIITRSRALDALRARDPAELMEDPALLSESGAVGGNPLDLLDATEGDHALHAALEQLDAEPRQLIALAFFRGLTHGEIAAHLGMPLGTVKSHIRRGLITLKTLLDEDART